MPSISGPLTADFKATPYWWEAEPLDGAPSGPLPGKAEVVVVSSGFAGLCCALKLAEGGHSVVVLDADYHLYGRLIVAHVPSPDGMRIIFGDTGGRGAGAAQSAYLRPLSLHEPAQMVRIVSLVGQVTLRWRDALAGGWPH